MNLLYLTFLFPLIGFLLLTIFNQRLSERISAVIGVGSMALSMCVAAWVAFQFWANPPFSGSYHHLLWNWIEIGQFKLDFALSLDGLSLTLLCIVTGVGFFIHWFAAWYMKGDSSFGRFFSYMNLFVVSMLLLVLSDNLAFIYLGWEGVGLCSYLLIGFYFHEPKNGRAAFKSFLVTRVGDTLMLIGLMALFCVAGTLTVTDILAQIPTLVEQHPSAMTFVALMLLGGAVGKSAQLPLQTWLPDAMAGPTPVSALIHAATMVTAGVYLVARMHPLYIAADHALFAVALTGSVTLLIAGFAALVQNDIKRILAYSTMSQIGYMFLALGVGAWHAAIFHLMTHAFFKALLFLSAGAVITACHHEQNIFKMGGLRKKLPFVYICFLVGGAALVAFPLISVGFYSKEEILWESLASGHYWFFAAGMLGAFLTAIYTFRLIFIVFHGESQSEVHPLSGAAYCVPLAVLLVLSTVVGAKIHPPLEGVLPRMIYENHQLKWLFELSSAGLVFAGIAIAFYLFLKKPQWFHRVVERSACNQLSAWMRSGFGFDGLYNRLFVRPFVDLAWLNRKDVVDQAIELLPKGARFFHELLSVTQSGQLRGYISVLMIGALLLLLVVFI